jgi:predicted MFS family arabinose efflux permease
MRTKAGENGDMGLPQQTTCLMIGVVALLIAGLQPLILGGWAHEGRLSEAEIGLAAMGELLALGITTSLAAAFLKPTHMRIKVGLACVGHGVITLAGLSLSSIWLAADRAVAGVFEGLMLWAAISMIVRSRSAERWAGVFATAQTLAQMMVSAALALWIIPLHGVNGALFLLAALSVGAGLAAITGPNRMAPLPKAAKDADGSLSIRPALGLAGIFLSMAFIVSAWVYLDPLARRAGLSGEMAGLMVSLALGAQVVGSLTATAISGRWPAAPILVGVAGLQALALIGMGLAPTAMVFAGCVILFGFLWMFAIPLHAALMIELDPTRRAALQIGAAQLLGSSFGPLTAGLILGDKPVANVLFVSAGLLVLSTLMFAAVMTNRSRKAPAAKMQLDA